MRKHNQQHYRASLRDRQAGHNPDDPYATRASHDRDYAPGNAETVPRCNTDTKGNTPCSTAATSTIDTPAANRSRRGLLLRTRSNRDNQHGKSRGLPYLSHR